MPLDQGQIEEAVAFLFHLFVHRERARALPHEIAPRTVDDAYAIQDALHSAAGWPIGVLKVGCTGEGSRQALGIAHPIAGRVPSEVVFESGVTLERSFFSGAPSIECEIAVLCGPGGVVQALAPAVELVAPRVELSGSSPGITAIADNSAAGAVIVGPPTLIGELDLDLDGLSVVLRSNDQVLVEGNSQQVDGGPMASLAWVSGHEADRGRSIEPGTWVITGSCTGLTPSAWNTDYIASFGDLGQVAFSLGA